MAKNFDILIARASSLKRTLANIAPQSKGSYVSRPLAENFNKLLSTIKKEMSADDSKHLPQPITFEGPSARVAGLSDVLHLDLEIMIDQLKDVLGHLKFQE